MLDCALMLIVVCGGTIDARYILDDDVVLSQPFQGLLQRPALRALSS